MTTKMEEESQNDHDKQILEFQYQEGLTDVVYIRVNKQKDKKDFHVNKGILMVMSPVFLKMMTQDFKEKKTGVICMKDKIADDVKVFLKCLYPNVRVEMTDEVIDKVLPLAHQYQVSILVNDCEDYLLRRYFSDENSFSKNPTTEKLVRFIWYGFYYGLDRIKKKSICLLALSRLETFVDLDEYKDLPSNIKSHVIMQRVRAFEWHSYWPNMLESDKFKRLNLDLRDEKNVVLGYTEKGSRSIWSLGLSEASDDEW